MLHHGETAGRLVSQRIGTPVATTTALKAVPAFNRIHGMMVLVSSDGSSWWFSDSSTAAASGGVLVPDAGNGRWLSVFSGANAPVHLVRAATTTNVTLSAVSTTIDTSVTLVAGNRVLVKDQNTASQNGIYVVGTVVAGPVAPFTRATDFDADADVQPGCLVSVAEGTLGGDTVWVCTSNATITVGSSNIAFGVAIASALTSTPPTTIEPDDTATQGVATTAARADHKHAIVAAAPLVRVGMAHVEGTAASFARSDHAHAGGVMYARGVVTSNVASLSAFVIAGFESLTYAAGERVLLVGQTTGTENGLYLVGTVAGTAPLTRAPEMPTAAAYINGQVVEVSEGALYANTKWQATCTGAKVVGTHDPLFSLKSVVGVMYARGVAISNVANLSAFVIAGFEGLTYAKNERVLLANQTTGSENGLYVVGAVAGTAPLTRAPEMPTAAAYINGQMVEVSEGAIYAGSMWKARCTGAKVVGTDDPLFYPKICKGTLTLASGTYTLGVTEGLYLFSTDHSTIQCTMNTPGGVLTLTTGGYGANVAGRTAGKSGTAAAIIIARVAAGTIDVANNSTVDWLICN